MEQGQQANSVAALQACHISSLNPGNAVHMNQTGACSVCQREGIHIVNNTGFLRQHGPRGNECKGSRTRPFPRSQKNVQRLPRLKQNVRQSVTMANNYIRIFILFNCCSCSA